MDGWKPTEKCYKCEDLIVSIGDNVMEFSCGRLKRATLTVPYLLVQLWNKYKDEVKGESECQEVPMAPMPQPTVERPKAWPMKRKEQFCTECELTMDPVEKYLEFTCTLYQLYQCKCGYAVYCLVSRIPRPKGEGLG